MWQWAYAEMCVDTFFLSLSFLIPTSAQWQVYQVHGMYYFIIWAYTRAVLKKKQIIYFQSVALHNYNSNFGNAVLRLQITQYAK